MANWKKLNTRKFVPDGIKEVLRVIQTANDGLEAALSVTQKVLNAARVFATAASVNPIEVALRAAVQEIEDFITGLLAQTTAHILMIPIQKQYTGIDFLESVDKFSLDSWLDKNANEGTYAQEVYRLNTPDTISFINHASTATGGNAGYWRTFILSLYDEGDFARPLFPSNYAVAGVSIICGANALNILLPVLDIFNHLLFVGTRGTLSSRILPTPHGLRARVIPIPNKEILGVQLDWPLIPVVLLRPAFTTDHFVVKNILVIRSTNPLFRQRFTWAQNFDYVPTLLSNDDPVVKTFEIDDTLDTQVIAQIKNTGFIGRYIDTVPLEHGKQYYYAIAALYEVGNVLQPISNLSNVEIVYFRNTIPNTRLSEPPDWFATPSLVQVFPILHSVLGEIKLFIAKILARTSSNNGVVNLILQLIAQINTLLLDARVLAAKLRRLESQLRFISNAETAGVRVTHIETKMGGIHAWAHELARRLSDTSDPSRPPYDHNEFVAGFVILAGAPREPQLLAFRKLLSIFFGESSKNPLEDALRSIDVTTRTGDGLLGQDGRPVHTSGPALAAHPAAVPPASQPRAPLGFDARMRPSDTPMVRTEIGTTTVFDETLTPADTADDC